MSAEQTPDIAAVREAIVTGLRKCRHEEAPVPLAQGRNEHHVAAMVLREVAPVLDAAVREARAAELREAAEDCEPHHEFGARWLRDRADRIDVDAPEGGA